MSLDVTASSTRMGLGVSSGICIGRAVVFTGGEPSDSPQDVGCAPVVLVGQCFSPEEVLSMDGDGVCGMVTATGSATASAGIVACSKGLPAVFACSLDDIHTGDLLIVDGTRGEVVIDPSPELFAVYEKRQQQYTGEAESLAAFRYVASETKEGQGLDVLASVDLADSIPLAITSGAAGIGLLRSEFYYLTGDGAPSEEFLFSVYQHALSLVAPLPVTIRTLDLSGGAQIQGLEQIVAANPALGQKGIRFSLHHSALFKTQLRALYRASAFGKLRILLPMVGSLDELRAAKKMIAEVVDDLTHAGVKMAEDVTLGVMIEVPSAVFIAADLAREVDFFSIGINDLIQYTLAVDRLDAVVSSLYEPLHPAILRILDQLIRTGHDAGIDVGVCGEMAGDDRYTPLFLGLGLDWVSMGVSSVSRVKKRVRASSSSACVELRAVLLQQDSAKESARILQEHLAMSHGENKEGLA